jgi:hypothetical protein
VVHQSDSSVQLAAEAKILELLQTTFGPGLKRDTVLLDGTSPVQVDAVSPNRTVFIEIFVHQAVGMMRRCGIALACALLVASVATSSAYASGGFGIERYTLTASEKGGSVDTQAGSHPYELTAEAALEPSVHTSTNEVKNLDFELPLGLVLTPSVVPNCTASEFAGGACAGASAVGEVWMSVAGKLVSAVVYNLAPAPGEFARLGFTLEGVLVSAQVSVRTGSDYGMRLSIQDLPQQGLESVKLTLGGVMPSTLLTLATSCASSPQTTLQGESWGGQTGSLSVSFSQMTGCERLSFNPSLSVAPDVIEADTPSGYTLELHVPQPEDPEGLASAELKEDRDGEHKDAAAGQSAAGCGLFGGADRKPVLRASRHVHRCRRPRVGYLGQARGST